MEIILNLNDLTGALVVLSYGWLMVYFLKKNILTYQLFRMDKYLSRQRHGTYRLSEASLIGFIVKGGAIGGILGLMVCRHKTLKPKFWLLSITFSVLWLIGLALMVPAMSGIINML